MAKVSLADITIDIFFFLSLYFVAREFISFALIFMIFSSSFVYSFANFHMKTVFVADVHIVILCTMQ